MNDLVIPLVVAVVTILLGTYTTVRLKYSNSKEELTTAFKKDFWNVAEYAVLVLNCYFLIDELMSNDELTRVTIFKICVLLLAICSFFLFRLLRDIVEVQKKQIEVMRKMVGADDNDNH